MTLNKHFNVHTRDLDDRPKPKLWLLKPDFTRIERLDGVSKIQGNFRANNLNTLTGQISPTIFDNVSHKQKRNPAFDLVKNKYLIEFHYNGFKDFLVINEIKNISTENDNVTFTAESLCSELSRKAANEIELLGSSVNTIMTKVFESYAPLWKLEHVDGKLTDVKREITMTNTTVMGIIDEINKQFDSVVIFDNKKRKVSFYHKDNVGVNRGLRIRENSYLKSFEDTITSKDVITRLYPFGNNGLTIQSVNPAGTDFIDDFSYFMEPFKLDSSGKVIKHSDYMSDELCKTLVTFQELYNSYKDRAEELSKRYATILDEHSQEEFKLNQLSANLERLQDRVEVLKPKSEYIELGTYRTNFSFYTPKSSYYILMLENRGSLANIRFGGQIYTVPSNDWLYLKVDTGDFKDATKFDEPIKHQVEFISANSEIRAILTRSSKVDFEDTEDDKIEKKYNLPKYESMVRDQAKVVGSIERRMSKIEAEKRTMAATLNIKNYLTDKTYKEYQSYIFAGIWTEDSHTDAKALYEDAVNQMKKQKEMNRSITIGLVNFTQSLEHKHDWDKLNVGDRIVFSNKIFNKKLKAYITEIQFNFEENLVTLTISDVIDYVDESKKVAELIATASSTSNVVNFHKEQIKSQQGKMTAMSKLIEAEWNANKKRIMAGNETVDIGAHGIKVISNENTDEYVAIVGGVIALTKDGGNTFKVGVNPDGVNAETLIGRMFIGENLELQNESGTIKFNKDGFSADVSSFHLTTNDGNDNYFDKLKQQMRDETSTNIDLLRQSIDGMIQNALDEAQDVEDVINKTIDTFKDAFKDGVISDVEKKVITETLSQLEKENREYLDEVSKALKNPFILDEDLIKLTEMKHLYEMQYNLLIEDVNTSISDAIITPEESNRIHKEILDFRKNVQELLSFLKEVINRSLENQLKQIENNSYDYTDRMKKDISDELNDVKAAMKKTNEVIESAMKDNIFDTVEIENINTVLMILKSEQEDVLNRFDSLYNNELLPEDSKTSLLDKKNELTNKYTEFTNFVTAMMSDKRSDDTEKANYKAKYESLTRAQSDFFDEYDKSVIALSTKYTDTREGHLKQNIDGLKEEMANDFKDVKDNMTELQATLKESFKDGIISATELTRLKMHLDMLDREYMDVQERYNEVVANNHLPEVERQALGVKRSPYSTAHNELRTIINNAIEDGTASASEKNTVDEKIATYNRTFADFTTAVQSALNIIARNIASDIANEKLQELNPVIENINRNMATIQNQIDKSIDTYFYGHAPTLNNIPFTEWTTDEVKDQHVGDLFLDTKTGLAYRFIKTNSTYQWLEIDDQAISKALNRSQNAMDLADNKRRIFVATPVPPYDVGDLWVQGQSGDALVCFTAKNSHEIYNDSDWVKAVKYTDDTTANLVLEQLNAFKSSTSDDLLKLKTDANRFRDEVTTAYEDKIISISEATGIKSRFKSVSEIKKRLEQKYSTLFKNPDLYGKPKSDLTTTFDSMNTSYQTLERTINAAITDNKINNTEDVDTNAAFENFLTTITNLEKGFDDAFASIIVNIAAKKAQEVQDRFDTWKRSEFTTTSESIVQRVSEANWNTTYLPRIEGNIATKVSKGVKDVTDKLDKTNQKLQQNEDNISEAERKIAETRHWVAANKDEIGTFNDNLTTLEDTINDVDNKLDKQKTKIDSTSSFIELNKDKIANSVSRTELQGELSKVATNQSRYIVQDTYGNPLKEYSGEEFDDNFTYEVTAKNITMSNDNVASAIFVSKGTNQGFELVELENKGTTGTHPRFLIDVIDRPCVSVYSAYGQQNIEVIYTKYAGSASSLKTTKSLIEQKSNEIKLEVKQLTKPEEPRNLLHNSDFENVFDGWSYVDPHFTVTDTNERAYSISDNLIANGESRVSHIGIKTNEKRTSLKLMTPLEAGKTYTLAFDYSLLEGTNSSGKVGLLPYFWPNASASNSDYHEFNARQNERNFYTFTCKEYANEILLYGAPRGTEDCKNCYPLWEKVTLMEGETPIEFEPNSMKKVVQMASVNDDPYPLLSSKFYPVGPEEEFKIGDIITFSVYVLIPEFAKDKIVGQPYLELAGYENVKQKRNASFEHLEIFSFEFQYNEWVRYSITTTIPRTTENGKVNFIRANLRYQTEDTPIGDPRSIFYYALPQLEHGPTVHKWENAASDILDSKRMASKIALNPQSIEMISRNLRINTDNVIIENTKGNFVMKNDELTVSNKSGSNAVRISSDGINIKKDGLNKMIDGLDTGATVIMPFQPRFASSSNYHTRPTTFSGLHVKEPNNDNYTGSYYYRLGERQLGERERTLIGLKNDCGRINRYIYYHDKPYLKIQLYYRSTGMTGYFHVTDQTNLKEFTVQNLPDRGRWDYVTIVADIGKPTYSFKNLELSIGSSGGSNPTDHKIEVVIMYMQLLNFKDYRIGG